MPVLSLLIRIKRQREKGENERKRPVDVRSCESKERRSRGIPLEIGRLKTTMEMRKGENKKQECEKERERKDRRRH